MTARLVGYSYPWDVLTPGFTERVAGLGLDEVAVAVAYHSTRAATPWSTEGTAVLARHAALYRPPREEAWAGRRLRPGVPDWTEDAAGDPAGAAVRVLREAGLRAVAWLVLTHDSRLGTEFPELAVRNCFGESYPWALCPAQAEVREYCATLTAESVRGLDPHSVVLEACGQLGAVHQCTHEKTDAVWSPAVLRLLSVCCCAACAGYWSESGVDGDRMRALLRDRVRALIAGGDVHTVDPGLPPETAAILLATRQRGTDLLRERVLAEIPAGVRVLLHGSADRWATGALPGLTDRAAEQVHGVVLPAWQAGPGSVATVRAARAELPSTVELGAYVTAAGPELSADFPGYVGELAAAGAGEIHLYHLGLAGPARWPALRAASAAVRTVQPERQS